MAVAKGRGSTQEWLQAAKPGYTDHMLSIYQQVVATGVLNYLASHIQLPSYLVFKEWECKVDTAENSQIVQFLRYCFPARYMGPVPTPTSENHQQNITCRI